MRKFITALAIAALALVTGCASTTPSASYLPSLEEIGARIEAERRMCEEEQEGPKESARCWFNLAARRSLDGDPSFHLDDMNQVLGRYGLTLSDIGLTRQDVESVRHQGHLAEARQDYDLAIRLAHEGYDISGRVGGIYQHLVSGNLSPGAIKPGLTFEALRDLERLGNLSEARKYLAIAREKPGTQGAVAAVHAIHRLLQRADQKLEDLEDGLTEAALDDLQGP